MRRHLAVLSATLATCVTLATAEAGRRGRSVAARRPAAALGQDRHPASATTALGAAVTPNRAAQAFPDVREVFVQRAERSAHGVTVSLRVYGAWDSGRPQPVTLVTATLAPDVWTTVAEGSGGVEFRLKADRAGKVLKEYRFASRGRVQFNPMFGVEVGATRHGNGIEVSGRLFAASNDLALTDAEASDFAVVGGELRSTAGLSRRLQSVQRTLDGSRLSAADMEFSGTLPPDGRLVLGRFGGRQVALEFAGDQLQTFSVVTE